MLLKLMIIGALDGNRIGCGEIPSGWKDSIQTLTHSDWLMWAQTGMEPELWVRSFFHVWWQNRTRDEKTTIVIV